MSRPGHSMQIFFSYSKDDIVTEINDIYQPAMQTAKQVELNIDDLFKERVKYLSQYCAQEAIYLVLWTRPSALTGEQIGRSNKEKLQAAKALNMPAFRFTQNVIAAITDLRDGHDSFVNSVVNDLNILELSADVLEVHEALRAMRFTVDPDFTDRSWRPILPGDKITIKESKEMRGDVSDILWPALGRQLLPRDAENMDLRTVRVGDRIYSSVFIDLFPREVQQFTSLLNRTTQTKVPWRISFLIDSGGLDSLRLRSALSSILAFSSAQNRLFNDAVSYLRYINLSTDDAVVKLRVVATTWAPAGSLNLLRNRAAQLSKAIQGWGSCDVSEVCGDAFAGVVSSMLGVSGQSVANASVAPLSDVLQMMPFFRPSSPWPDGALLFRSPDGKPWPYQPGSAQQTTWIDILYARPGSGKSVLSNAINLALCLSAGIQRLPHIAIVDIGPSSSGLVSLIKEALPTEQKHLVAYHRLRMIPEMSINPFDTQLGCREPSPQERAFLVNFLTLLATPVGQSNAYDGITDMAGLIVDELYKSLSDSGNPHLYTP